MEREDFEVETGIVAIRSRRPVAGVNLKSAKWPMKLNLAIDQQHAVGYAIYTPQTGLLACIR